MTRSRVILLLALGQIALSGAALPAHAAGPQHDVFERPKPRTLKQQDAETVKTLKPAPAPIEWKPELRALISGGETAWVNVEGRILQVGQDIDGFRLVEVQERSAVFVKDNARYTLDLPAVKASPRQRASGVAPAADTPSVAASKSAADAVPGSDGKGGAAGTRGALDAAPTSGTKGEIDVAPAIAGKGAADGRPGRRDAADPVPERPGRSTNERVPIGTIRSSAILPSASAPPVDNVAEARGR
jgi:hypothetical protein